MPTLQFKGKTFVQNHHLAVKYHQLVPQKKLRLTDKVSLHDNLTITALRNREHPSRQILDISKGGRTLVKEKAELFNRLDVEEHLVVLMLMLPSASNYFPPCRN